MIPQEIRSTDRQNVYRVRFDNAKEYDCELPLTPESVAHWTPTAPYPVEEDNDFRMEFLNKCLEYFDIATRSMLKDPPPLKMVVGGGLRPVNIKHFRPERVALGIPMGDEGMCFIVEGVSSGRKTSYRFIYDVRNSMTGYTFDHQFWLDMDRDLEAPMPLLHCLTCLHGIRAQDLPLRLRELPQHVLER